MIFVAVLMVLGWMSANHFGPWVSWHNEISFFAAALLLAVLSVHRAGARTSALLPISAVLPLGLGGVLLLQTAFNQIEWMGQSWTIVLYLLLIIFGLIAGTNEAADSTKSESNRAGEWLAWTLIIGLMLSMLVALAQVLDVFDGWSWIAPPSFARRPGGNLAQPNHLATLLVMAMGASCFLFINRRIGRAALMLMMVLWVIGIAVTESRTALLSVIALCALWLMKRPSAAAYAPSWYGWVLAFITLAAFLCWPMIYQILMPQIPVETSAAERLASSGGDPRLIIWRQMLEASLQHPWTGWGMRQTAEAQNAVAHMGGSTLPITYSHNLVIDFLVWFGWPIAIVLVGIASLWGWRRMQHIQQSALSWFGMALLAPFAVHSLLEFPYAYAYLLLPAVVGIGWIDGADPAQPQVRCPSPFLTVGFAGFAFIGLWSVYDYVRVEEDFRVARFEQYRIGTAPTTSPPRILLLDQLGELLASTRIPLNEGMSAKELQLLGRAARHYPWPGTQFRFVTALALNGQMEEAKRQMIVLWAQQGDRAYLPLLRQLNDDLRQRRLPMLDMPKLLPGAQQ